MSKNTRNYVVILVGLILLLVLWPKKQRSNEKIELSAHNQKINKISIEKEAESFQNFILADKSGTKDWKVVYTPNSAKEVVLSAEKTIVNELIDILSEDTKLELISKKSKLISSYGLNSDDKITIKAYSDEKVVRELIVGAVIEKYSGVYVLYQDSIYRLPLEDRELFKLDVKKLASKNIFNFIVANIQSMKITKNTSKGKVEKNLVLENVTNGNESSAWVNVADKKEKLNRADVNGLLAGLAGLKCEEFLFSEEGTYDSLNSKTSTKSTWSIVLTTGDGVTSYKLLLLDENGGLNAVSSTTDYKFVLHKENYDTMIADLQKIF